MRPDEEILIDQPAPGLRRITLNRPSHMNALTPTMRTALRLAIESTMAQPETRALILTGAGGDFCSGGDVAFLAALPKPGVADLLRDVHRLVRLLIESGKPVVVAIEGYAAGGGAGLALACDTVLMSERASFLLPFHKLGLVADCGLFHTLPRRVGWARAHQLLLRPERIDAAAAQALGLADVTCPSGDLQERAVALASDMSKQSPLALAWTKRLMLAQLPPLDTAFDLEVEAQLACFASPAFEAGAAAFLARRDADG